MAHRADPRIRGTILTVNDKLLDRAIRHAHWLERLKSHEVNKILADLNRNLYPRILRELERVESVDIEDWGGRMRVSPRLTEARNRIDKLISDEIKAASKRLDIDLDAIADMESNWSIQVIHQEMPVVVRLNEPSPELLRSIRVSRPFNGKLLKDWHRDLDRSLRSKVSGAINTGIADGSSIPDIVRSLRGTRKNKFKDGILETSRRETEAVVRTAVNHITTKARDISYEANTDVVKGVQWLSTLDSKTTLVCFAGSTRVLPIGPVRKVFRRLYDDDLLVIRTASGKELRVTPNHPILTAGGWRPAQELHPFEQVVYSVSGDGLCVSCCENVGVPATLSELADAAFDPTISEIHQEGTTAADFHGDGVGLNDKVYIAELKCHLSSCGVPRSFEAGEDEAFTSIQRRYLLPSSSGFSLEAFGGTPSDVAAKFASSVAKYAVDGRDAVLGPSMDVERLSPATEHRENALPVDSVVLTSLEGSHYSEAFERGGDGGSCDVVIPCQRCGTLSVSVSPDDVVEVRRELGVRHVFNIECEAGAYLAEGVIVKNCAGLDGTVFKVGEGQRPPAHFSCRSTTTPILKTWREMGINIDEPPVGTRADRNMKTQVVGDVPADVSYGEWLKTQSKADVRRFLGPGRADLFLNQGVPIEKFTRNNRVLTIDQVKKLEGI